MAIKKEFETKSGTKGEYWRIEQYDQTLYRPQSSDEHFCTNIILALFVNKEARDNRKTPLHHEVFEYEQGFSTVEEAYRKMMEEPFFVGSEAV
jgi:hypothetical protein